MRGLLWNLHCEKSDLRELADIEPVHVSVYVETLQKRLAPPSVKQHLAATRMLFDWLVVGQRTPSSGSISSRRKGRSRCVSFWSWRLMPWRAGAGMLAGTACLD